MYVRGIAGGGELQTLIGRPATIQSLADVDADGAVDIVGVTGAYDTMIAFPWANAGDGAFVPGTPVAMPDIAPGEDFRHRLVAADVDGDGRQDVVVGSNSILRILFGSTDGLRCYADLIIQHRATYLAAGDLDGDGRAEIAFSDGTTTTVHALE